MKKIKAVLIIVGFLTILVSTGIVSKQELINLRDTAKARSEEAIKAKIQEVESSFWDGSWVGKVESRGDRIGLWVQDNIISWF